MIHCMHVCMLPERASHRQVAQVSYADYQRCSYEANNPRDVKQDSSQQ